MRCTKCPLHKSCKSVKVPSRGADNPRVLFVGQAPGEQEDEHNRCFIGPAGQVLTKAIEKFNVKPTRLTNLVRCFPPGDRAPKKEEIEACKPYLMKEIKKYEPDYIVALGNYPLRALTGKNGVTSYSGKVVGKIKSSSIFSLFHPSYILRSQRMTPKFEMHFRALRQLLTKERAEKVKVDVCSPQEASKRLKKAEKVAFDYETTGLYKAHGAKVRCCGFYTGTGNPFVVEAGTPGFREMMIAFLKSDCQKIAHNLVFETRWSIEEFGVDPKIRHDTMLKHFLLDENSSHDLESMAGSLLGVTAWDISGEMQSKGLTYETVPFPQLAQYNGTDVLRTYQCNEKLEQNPEWPHVQGVYQNIHRPLARLCAKLEMRGIKIDVDYSLKMAKVYVNRCAKIKEKIIRKHKLPEKFNPNSSPQLRELLLRKKVDTKEYSKKTGLMSVKKSSLEPLVKTHSFLKRFIRWKELNGNRNNYLAKFPKFADKQGLVHAGWNPAFIVTLRVATGNPPVQNIPRDPEVRGIVISRFPGGKLCSTDYDQLEMKLVASESREERLLQAIEKGEDLHNLTAAEMFGAEYTDDDRSVAKNINFGTVYGISAWSLSKKFNVSNDVAENWVYRFKRIYPRLTKWMAEQHEFAKKHGYLVGRTGMRRRFPGLVGADEKTQARMLRQAGNFPIQHWGAAITDQAAVEVDLQLEKGGFKSMLVAINHDALLVDVYPGEEKKVAALVRRVMTEDIPARYKDELRVKLTVSQEITERWGQEVE